jgi:hypothetical protein
MAVNKNNGLNILTLKNLNKMSGNEWYWKKSKYRAFKKRKKKRNKYDYMLIGFILGGFVAILLYEIW